MHFEDVQVIATFSIQEKILQYKNEIRPVYMFGNDDKSKLHS